MKVHSSKFSTPRLAGVTLVLAATAATSSAYGSGFSTARFGGEHGHPVTFNPTALYYNPAGIAESEGYHIFVDGNIAFRAATYDHSAAPNDTEEPPGAAGANTGIATLSNVAAAPMIGATGKFGKSLAVGLAFYVPVGGSAKWDTDDDFAEHERWPGPVDGEQRWYSIEGTIRSLYWTLGAAYKIPNTGLSLGLAGSLIRSEIKTIRARTGEGDDNIANEGRSFIDVGDWAWGFGVGATYEFLPKKLWAGFSYTSRPSVVGGMKLDGQLNNVFPNSAPTSTPVEVHQDLPDIYRLGVRFAPRKDIELRLFGDFTRWSAFDNQCVANEGAEECLLNEQGQEVDASGNVVTGGGAIVQNLPRNWNDAFGIRAGGSYWVNEKVELFAGVGYDSNAIPDEAMDPALTDFHDISVALGGRMQLIKQLAGALSYTHFFYISRDTTGKNGNSDFLQPSRGPDAGGKYSQRVGVININLELTFGGAPPPPAPAPEPAPAPAPEPAPEPAPALAPADPAPAPAPAPEPAPAPPPAPQ